MATPDDAHALAARLESVLELHELRVTARRPRRPRAPRPKHCGAAAAVISSSAKSRAAVSHSLAPPADEASNDRAAKACVATSAPVALTESLVVDFTTMMTLEPHGPDTFVGTGPEYPWGGLYGGQIVAQALGAAGHSVDPRFVPHSLHAYFIRPGNATEPIRFEVDRDRDGRSFCTRRVVVRQSIGVILNLAASFQVIEDTPHVQAISMPDVPAADALTSPGWSSLFERRFVAVHGAEGGRANRVAAPPRADRGHSDPARLWAGVRVGRPTDRRGVRAAPRHPIRKREHERARDTSLGKSRPLDLVSPSRRPVTMAAARLHVERHRWLSWTRDWSGVHGIGTTRRHHQPGSTPAQTTNMTPGFAVGHR